MRPANYQFDKWISFSDSVEIVNHLLISFRKLLRKFSFSSFAWYCRCRRFVCVCVYRAECEWALAICFHQIIISHFRLSFSHFKRYIFDWIRLKFHRFLRCLCYFLSACDTILFASFLHSLKCELRERTSKCIYIPFCSSSSYKWGKDTWNWDEYTIKFW